MPFPPSETSPNFLLSDIIPLFPSHLGAVLLSQICTGEIRWFSAGWCFIFLSFSFFSHRSDGAGSQGTGAQWLDSTLSSPVFTQGIFFFHTHVTIFGIPMFSVMWLGFRGNLLTSVPGVVVIGVAGPGSAARSWPALWSWASHLKSLFLIYKLRGLE